MSAGDDDLPLTLKGLHRTPGGHVTVEVGMECFDMARELEQVCAERDAAQARVRALVAVLQRVRDDLAMRSQAGVVDLSAGVWCRLEDTLNDPDTAALVARERARDAVVEAARKVADWLNDIIREARVPRSCGACGTPDASCDMDCANAAYLSRDMGKLRAALDALAPTQEDR